MTTGYVDYDSNNSGGGWWLTDEDWLALEAAGWFVDWIKDSEHHQRFGRADRWLGALAKSARRKGLSLRDAVAEWERVTGKSSTDAGCPCCGAPHSFTEYDADGKYIASGPTTEHVASW